MRNTLRGHIKKKGEKQATDQKEIYLLFGCIKEVHSGSDWL